MSAASSTIVIFSKLSFRAEGRRFLSGRSRGIALPPPTCKTVLPHTNHSYPSARRQAFSAPPQPRRSVPATPRRAETNTGYDNANVRTRLPQLRKGRRHARLSAGMLVHSNQVGEGKEKLSKPTQQTKLSR